MLETSTKQEDHSHTHTGDINPQKITGITENGKKAKLRQQLYTQKATVSEFRSKSFIVSKS